MTLLYPLGLLGLIGLIVLIIIYIIKPNYQQKFVSTTFVWKLSLKYRKKKIPISKLRNILLIICQVLILSICAMILTRPSEVLKTKVTETEVIAIVDASASMRTQVDGESRFRRAVDAAQELTSETVRRGGIASLILADIEASVLVTRATSESEALLEEAFEPLVEQDACSYGVSDIEGAIALCEDILAYNPYAKIHLFTDTVYINVPEGITVENEKVCDEEEWNASILDATAILEEGYFTFYVDVACYGQPREVEVRLEVQGANAADSTQQGQVVVFSQRVYCELDVVKTVKFICASIADPSDMDVEDLVVCEIPLPDAIKSYQQVHVGLNESDSFAEDNNFDIYNGQKEVLRIQYVSSEPNPFFPNVLYTIKYALANSWDIRITEVKKDGEYKEEGYDVYIFEHAMPEKLPADGVVILADPDTTLNVDAPVGSGVQLKGTLELGKSAYLAREDETHPVVRNLDVDSITVSRVISASYDASYVHLMSCANTPVVSVKNEGTSKIAVMAFSLHYSNLPLLKEFPLLFYNIIDYFFPVTVQGNSFEVYESVELNAIGEELFVSRGVGDEALYTYNEFPSKLKLDLPGTYVLTQSWFNRSVTERIYVKIPTAESDIWDEAEGLTNPYVEQNQEDYFRDLLMYFAVALVALLFLEWILQCKDNM